MNWFKRSVEDVIHAIGTDPLTGLNPRQVEEKRQQYGLNVFEEAKKETIGQQILHHLTEVTSLVLLGAAAISAYLAITIQYGWPKVCIILGIVVINIVLAIYQEKSAEKALDALKKMNAPSCTVLRDGIRQEMDASLLVPGDIIEINAGDMIPADARIIENSSLLVEESALTGESLPVEKDATVTVAENAPLGDRINMIYSGCLVTNGRAKALVVATGMATEMGKIAGLLNATGKLQTPLQMRLTQLAKRLSLVALVAAVIIFIVGVFVYDETMIDMLMVAISLGVAAVPETLPIIVTMTLAFGVQHMASKKAIIRRIPAIETVGNTSVICSDKTGTLTQNKMVIQKIWQAEQAEACPVEADFSEAEMLFLEMLSVSNNATIEAIDGEEKIIGDPTESSIIRLLKDKGITKKTLEAKYPRVFELPFDSGRKLMTTIHQVGERYLSITKGAFDRIPVEFEATFAKKAQAMHDVFANQALRVIAGAYRYYDAMPTDLTAAALEKDLHFAGMVGMIDPPRPESKHAVDVARAAGIKSVMITGDHIGTATAIAREIGIMQPGDKAITGAELAAMSEADLIENVRHISVYARVSPEDKIRIVKAWQANNEVVAMTGDGVNDAPALKAADVGLAMGITGTDVSKSASDMIITDDNFATIVDAISVGRAAYDNIRKTIYFLLSTNFSQILIMLIGVSMGWGAPIIAVQLLFINVVSDGIPGFFLSKEQADQSIMQRKPIDRQAGVYADGLGKKIVTQMTLFTVLTLLAFYIGQFVAISQVVLPSYSVGVTMAFLVLSLKCLPHILNVRSDRSIFEIGFTSNMPLLLGALVSVCLILMLALIRPLAAIFYLVPLSPLHWLIVVIFVMIPFVFVEIEKKLTRRIR